MMDTWYFLFNKLFFKVFFLCTFERPKTSHKEFYQNLQNSTLSNDHRFLIKFVFIDPNDKSF